MAKRKSRIHSRALITNCEERFSFKCPKLWKELALTEDDKVRYCSACEKNVHLCETEAELDRCAREGLCAAVENLLAPVLGNMIVTRSTV